MTTRKTVFVDTSLCTGCKGCSVACKAWNELPAEKTKLIYGYISQDSTTPTTWTYMSYHEKYENGKMNFLMFKHQCYHCAEPSCMKACPVGAISKTESGYTLINQDKCIGCGYCVANCPWGVPKTDKTEKKTYKCTGCIDRVENGLQPACVHTCQPGALQFGEREEMLQKAKARLEVVKKTYPKAQLYGDKIMGGTTYVYLLLDEPETYGLPANPTTPSSLVLWKDIVQPYCGWLIPLAAAGAVGSFFSTRLINVMNSKSKGGSTHGQ
ncbi:MAG: 4Fe-4S dicluster domain-containing protein [Syntrophomonadaceae bacterium]|nr:4Fe-4S dicluster domain-containing protein [Syntrophomonadaceae bacterium]